MPADYSLPFCERYHALRRTLRDLPGIIERTRAHIAQQQDYLSQCEHQMAAAEADLVRMTERSPDWIEAIEDHHRTVRGILRKAGWNLPEDGSPADSGQEDEA